MRLWDKGNELFKAKEFRSAVDAYTLSLALEANSAPVHANRAAAYMKLRRWEDAEADCTAALVCEPGYFKALMRRGAVRLETGVEGAEAAALEDLKAAEEIEPDNKELQRLKVKAQRGVTDKVERKSMKRMSITEIEDERGEQKDASVGGDAASSVPAGDTQKGSFSFDKKKNAQTSAAAAAPSSTVTTFGPPPALRIGPIDQAAEGEDAKNRGNAHFKQHRFAEAAAAYTEALVNMPGMAAAYCNRSGAHFHLDRHAEATSDASSALALDPAYAKAFHRRAAARSAMGEVDAAARDYDAAIAAAPGTAADLRAEKKAMLDGVRGAGLKPARQGPMVIEEVEAEETGPDPAQSMPPTPGAKPAAAGGRKKIQIQEDSDDEEEAEVEVATEPVPPAPAATPAAPTQSRRKIAIVEDDDSSDEDDRKPATTSRATPSATERAAAEAMKKAGDEAFKRGEMQTADARYADCLASPGGTDDDTIALAVRANRAAARLKLGDFLGAEADATAALAIEPGHVKSAHRRAAARVKLGKLEEALVDYAVVRQAFPRHKGVLAEIEEAEGLSATARAAGQTARTRETFEPAALMAKAAAATANTDEVAALKAKGNDAFVHQRYREAEDHYSAAIASPAAASDAKLTAVLLANRAASRLKLGDFPGAERDAGDAIAADGGYTKGFHRRAAALSAQGKFEDALEDYEVVVRANPSNAALQAEVNACMQKAAEVMLGSLDLGGFGTAGANAGGGGGGGGSGGGGGGGAGRRAVVIEEDSDDDSEDDSAGPGVGEEAVSTTASKEDDTLKVAAASAVAPAPAPAAFEAAPTHTTTSGAPVVDRQRIAIVEEDSSDEEETGEERAASGAEQKSGLDDAAAAEAAKVQGNALFKAGDFAASETAYARALTFDATSVACYANRAAVRLKRGDAEGAAADASCAVALDPGHVKAHHRRAIALTQLGRHAATVEDYRVVEAAYPGHAGVAAEAAAARAANAADIASRAAESFSKPRSKSASSNPPYKDAESKDSPTSSAADATSPKATVARDASAFGRPHSADSAAAVAPSPSPLSKEALAAKAAKSAAPQATKKTAKPRTGTEFERGCRSLRGKPGELSTFVGQLSHAELRKTLGDSVSATILGAYSEVFSEVLLPAGDGAAVAETAAALATLPRFAINAMLLTKSDKAAMKKVFDALGASSGETRKAWNV